VSSSRCHRLGGPLPAAVGGVGVDGVGAAAGIGVVVDVTAVTAAAAAAAAVGTPAQTPQAHPLLHTTSDSQTATAAVHTANYSLAKYLTPRTRHWFQSASARSSCLRYRAS